MKKNKICVIGAGKWGKNHIKTLKKLEILGGIIDKDPKNLASLKSKYPKVSCYDSYKSSLKENFDGYIISTPSITHAAIAKKILFDRKPVLVEKPLSLNLRDALEIKSILNETNGKLLVGHLLLLHPAIIRLKELISNGKIGKIQYIYSNRLNLGTIRKDENVFWSFAPHDLALFQYFTTSFPNEVFSVGGDFLQKDIHDTTMTYFKYPNDIHGHIYVSWLHPFKEHRLVIIGSKGSLHFESKTFGDELFFYKKLKKIKDVDPQKISFSSVKPLLNQLKYFNNVINGEKIIINGIDDAIDVIKLLEIATNSLENIKK